MFICINVCMCTDVHPWANTCICLFVDKCLHSNSVRTKNNVIRLGWHTSIHGSNTTPVQCLQCHWLYRMNSFCCFETWKYAYTKNKVLIVFNMINNVHRVVDENDSHAIYIQSMSSSRWVIIAPKAELDRVRLAGRMPRFLTKKLCLWRVIFFWPDT